MLKLALNLESKLWENSAGSELGVQPAHAVHRHRELASIGVDDHDLLPPKAKQRQCMGKKAEVLPGDLLPGPHALSCTIHQRSRATSVRCRSTARDVRRRAWAISTSRHPGRPRVWCAECGRRMSGLQGCGAAIAGAWSCERFEASSSGGSR